MRNGSLLKVLIFIIAISAVTLVIIATMHSGPKADSIGSGQGRSFFGQFVVAGGPIVWFVLMPMSLIMVYLAFEYCLTIRRKKLVPSGTAGQITEYLQQLNTRRSETGINNGDDFVSTAVRRAISRGGGDWFRMRSELFESLQEQASVLMRKIEWLNLIGNVSPMVGLFGTVFGMIKLFNAIVIAGGQPQPAQLAEGISVALVTTFWGLFIAIPALAFHGFFRNRIEILAGQAVTEAEGILPQIKYSFRRHNSAEPQSPDAAKAKLAIQELAGKSSTSAHRPSTSKKI